MRRRRRKRLSNRELDFLYKTDVLCRFVEAHGWSAVVKGTKVSNVSLFRFVVHNRAQYRKDRIADFAVEALEAVPGWSWDPRRDRHRRALEELRRLVRKHGWHRYASSGGARGEQLRLWCANRRVEKRHGTIDRWLVAALEAIPGWSWEPRDDQYDLWLRRLREHVERHGWESLRRKTRVRSGAALCTWVNWVRYQYRRDAVPDWVVRELDRMDGWTWMPLEDQLRRKVELLRDFIARHGWGEFRTSLVIEDVPIGRWVHSCLSRRRRGELSAWLCEQLEEIPGWSWEPREDAFEDWLRSLRAHVKRHGWETMSPRTRDESGAALGQWVHRVRQLQRRGALPDWVRRELEQIDGWQWNPFEDQHRRKLEPGVRCWAP